MLILLFSCFSLSDTFYVSLNGSDISNCTWMIPCSFERVKIIAQNYDQILINEQHFSKKEELRILSNFFSFAASKNLIVRGDNATIDGSEYENDKLAFIFANKADEIKIGEFKFVKFQSTIICAKSVMKLSIFDCEFIDNRISTGLGAITSSCGSLKLRNCKMHNNFVTNSFFLGAFSSQLYLRGCYFNKNIACKYTKGLLFYSNSITEIRNSIFMDNLSPYSPLVTFEYRSYLTCVSSTFQNNVNQYVWYADGPYDILLVMLDVHRNNGALFKGSSSRSELSIQFCNFTYIDANECPLFEVYYGYIEISKRTSFRNNIGSCFCEFNNKQSIIDISQAEFRMNSFSNCFININDNAYAIVQNSNFTLNYVPNGMINGNHSLITLYFTIFSRNIGQIINCVNCKADIQSSIFNDCSESPIVLISDHNNYYYSQTKIGFCQFFTRALPGHSILYIKGAGSISFSRFSEKKDVALKVSVPCLFCDFNQKTPGIYKSYVIYMSFLATLSILLVLLFHAFNFCRFRK